MAEVRGNKGVIISLFGELIIQLAFTIQKPDGRTFRTGIGIILIPQAADNTDATVEPTYTISQLAGEFGVTARTIRFYKDKQLLQPRRKGLSCIYGRRDRTRLKLILKGKRLGFSLSDIGEMLALYDPLDEGQSQLKVMLQKSRRRLADLERQRLDIDEVIAELEDNCALIGAELERKH